MAHLIPYRMRFQSALRHCPVVLLALAVLQPPAEAANLYWDFAPGTANGASNGGGTYVAPGNWFAASSWDKGTGNGYQTWADGNDAFIAASFLQINAAVTANSLNVTGSVTIQADAAATNPIFTLTNGGTIASGGTMRFGGDGTGADLSVDVRLGSDINSSVIGTRGTFYFSGGAVISSDSASARSIFANVSIGNGAGGLAGSFGDTTRNGTIYISGNLANLGGASRIFGIASGTTVEVGGNYTSASTTLRVNGGGTLQVNGMTTTAVANGFAIGPASGADGTTLELIGGGVMTSTGSSAGTMASNIVISSANNTLRVNSSFAQSATAGVQTFSGVISGAGKIMQEGSGTFALTNTNTYTGSTTVSGGVLQVGSAGVGTTGTGAVTVQTGSTLLGTGTVRGSTFTAQSGSIIHSGDGSAATNFGTLRFTPSSGSGSFNFAAGSSTILGLNPGGTGDLLNFDGLSAGTLTFDGNLTITAPGYVPTSEETFNLLDWANLTSTFASRYAASSYSSYLLGNGDDNLGFDLPDIAGSGYGWDISQFIINGTISTVMLVPEPGRASLLLAGVCGLLLRRRRMVA